MIKAEFALIDEFVTSESTHLDVVQSRKCFCGWFAEENEGESETGNFAVSKAIALFLTTRDLPSPSSGQKEHD